MSQRNKSKGQGGMELQLPTVFTAGKGFDVWRTIIETFWSHLTSFALVETLHVV